jgi:hypothetical protein
MNIHELKTRETFFRAIVEREKRFEIRKNDRGFMVADLLVLREWTGTRYTASVMTAKVVYMTDFEQQPGFVVMGIDIIDVQLAD